MIKISKGKEPKSLRDYRIGTPDAYNGLNRKNVRIALLKEQKSICAYCMQQISDNKYFSIEHYRSQHLFPDLQLDYKNMLGVCNGNADSPQHRLICDKSKSKFDKSYSLTVNPLLIEHINQIKYTREGEIYSENANINYDINTVLNLNEQRLKDERGDVYSQTKKRIRSFKIKFKGVKAPLRNRLSLEKERLLEKAISYSPLIGVQLYVINKELDRLNMS